MSLLIRSMIICFVLLGSRASAQYGFSALPYYGAMWEAESCEWWGTGTINCGTYWKYYTNSDSTHEFYLIDTDTIGVLRLDSSLDKVYYRSISTYYTMYDWYYDTTERLLYDFTLSVGDTVPNYMGLSSVVTVTDVDTTMRLGEPRKMLVLSNWDTLIHGMGSTEDLLRPFLSTFEGSYNVCEFTGTARGDGVQFVLEYVDHFCAVGIESESQDDFQLSVYPNPTQGRVTIKTSEHGIYRITDINGRIVRSGRITGNQETVDLLNLENGMYFIAFEDKAIRKMILSNPSN